MLKKITTFVLLFTPSISSAADIKGIKDPNMQFMDFIFYQFFIILLLVVLYLYYVKFINKKKKKKIKGPNKTKELIISLKKIKKECSKLTKSNFYSEMNSYFRDYFDILEVENSDTLTFSDVKKLNINKSVINLFEKSYMLEFRDEKDTEKIRIEIIDKLIKIIK